MFFKNIGQHIRNILVIKFLIEIALCIYVSVLLYQSYLIDISVTACCFLCLGGVFFSWFSLAKSYAYGLMAECTQLQYRMMKEMLGACKTAMPEAFTEKTKPGEAPQYQASFDAASAGSFQNKTE